ncbi:hypothetical protein HMPREF9004_1092 [Schaalia cardiffensis F0333]|uniref:Uncharacterized protein n=1 Tax=Schaalia cardiffensis F0333 TaxID=888050 RepID=N6XAH8_9ACTO|nr:hypothetical protein HMPREF9004_1092 [Schaalia cardiffensis F0333]
MPGEEGSALLEDGEGLLEDGFALLSVGSPLLRPESSKDRINQSAPSRVLFMRVVCSSQRP